MNKAEEEEKDRAEAQALVRAREEGRIQWIFLSGRARASARARA